MLTEEPVPLIDRTLCLSKAHTCIFGERIAGPGPSLPLFREQPDFLPEWLAFTCYWTLVDRQKAAHADGRIFERIVQWLHDGGVEVWRTDLGDPMPDNWVHVRSIGQAWVEFLFADADVAARFAVEFGPEFAILTPEP